jgi:SWI/SNF-related matrix-associated actin-dependent regulator 1 of chromatin subfamily A
MKIVFDAGRFVAFSSFEERFILKGAGFRWNPDARIWWTDKPAVALKVANAFDPSAKEAAQEAERHIEASKKTDHDIAIPCPEGLAYLPFQRAGIAYALERQSTLIADEMGLGKTIQALGVVNTDNTIKRILIICPASLRLNWKRESEKWLMREFTIQIVEGRGSVPMNGDIIIINYDVIQYHRKLIDLVEWDLLIADEAHYLKNAKTKRTRAIIGKWDRKEENRIPAIKSRRRLLLTGTPIVNRPVELWTLVSYLLPGTFSNFFSYAKRYCNATKGRFGWDFTGAINLDELQDTLRSSCMVRRLKKDVLTDLPPKRRQIIEIPQEEEVSCVKAENKISEQWEGRLNDLQARLELAEAGDAGTESIMRSIQEAQKMAFTEMAKARHDTAVTKIPYCADHIIEAVESSGSVVCFAHHHDVIDGLRAALNRAGVSSVELTGETAMTDRQAAVDAFQEGRAQVFIGSISAAGVGLTLTRSSHVVFCELPWTPSELSQAEDRCHRIGQKGNVLVQHIVMENSIDQRMAQALVSKQEVIDKALDVMVRKVLEASPVMPTKEKRSSRALDIERIAKIITPEQIALAHSLVREIAIADPDMARQVNGIGFSKIDNIIGHELAEKPNLSSKQGALAVLISWKYRRQVGAQEFETLIKG